MAESLPIVARWPWQEYEARVLRLPNGYALTLSQDPADPPMDWQVEISGLKGADGSLGGEVLRRLVELSEPPRPWTYCADALPARGRYEVAYSLSGEGLFICRSFWTGERWNCKGRLTPIAIYAWRPIAEGAPTLRPADRQYLIDRGVPPEWLGPPEED